MCIRDRIDGEAPTAGTLTEDGVYWQCDYTSSGASSVQKVENLTPGAHTLYMVLEDKGDRLGQVTAVTISAEISPYKLYDRLIQDGKNVGFSGKIWGIVGADGHGIASEKNTVTLFTKEHYGRDSFSDASVPKEQQTIYSGSRIAKKMESIYEALIPREKALVKERLLESGEVAGDYTQDPAFTADRVQGENVMAHFWLPSALELSYVPYSKFYGHQILTRSVIKGTPISTSYSTLYWSYNPGWWSNHVDSTSAANILPMFIMDTSNMLFEKNAAGIMGANGFESYTRPEGDIKFAMKDTSLSLNTVDISRQMCIRDSNGRVIRLVHYCRSIDHLCQSEQYCGFFVPFQILIYFFL